MEKPQVSDRRAQQACSGASWHSHNTHCCSSMSAGISTTVPCSGACTFPCAAYNIVAIPELYLEMYRVFYDHSTSITQPSPNTMTGGITPFSYLCPSTYASAMYACAQTMQTANACCSFVFLPTFKFASEGFLAVVLCTFSCNVCRVDAKSHLSRHGWV